MGYYSDVSIAVKIFDPSKYIKDLFKVDNTGKRLLLPKIGALIIAGEKSLKLAVNLLQTQIELNEYDARKFADHYKLFYEVFEANLVEKCYSSNVIENDILYINYQSVKWYGSYKEVKRTEEAFKSSLFADGKEMNEENIYDPLATMLVVGEDAECYEFGCSPWDLGIYKLIHISAPGMP